MRAPKKIHLSPKEVSFLEKPLPEGTFSPNGAGFREENVMGSLKISLHALKNVCMRQIECFIHEKGILRGKISRNLGTASGNRSQSSNAGNRSRFRRVRLPDPAGKAPGSGG